MAKRFGKWQIVVSLPAGGQGYPHVVRHIDDNREAFLKCLINIGNEQRRKRFELEALTAQELDHPGIPKMLDLCLDTKKPYIVFEYRKGKTLEEYAKEHHGPLEVLRILIETHEIIAYVHSQDKCHRDIKPDHVIIGDDGRVSVVDFGLVYDNDRERATLPHEAVGSRYFMAPELEDGRGTVTPCCDVYSLGKTLYFAMSGGKIFSRERHREADLDLVAVRHDPRLERVSTLLDAMICAKPADRLPNAGAVLPEVKRLLEYFQMIEWERTFTIKDGELKQHGGAWIPSGKGWFKNDGNENKNWSIFGPYVIDPPLGMGLYEATYVLRAREQPGSGNPANGNAVIDVATAGGGAKGSRILAARRLAPMDMRLGKDDTEAWRKHSLVFLYDGDGDIEFRILKDSEQDKLSGGVRHGTYTLEFSHITVRKLAWPTGQMA